MQEQYTHIPRGWEGIFLLSYIYCNKTHFVSNKTVIILEWKYGMNAV